MDQTTAADFSNPLGSADVTAITGDEFEQRLKFIEFGAADE